MNIIIDFEKKEIHYLDNVELSDLAEYLVKYFSDDVWADFQIVINDAEEFQTIVNDIEDGIDENTNTNR